MQMMTAGGIRETGGGGEEEKGLRKGASMEGGQ